MSDRSIFQTGLGRGLANFAPLTPLGFLPRTAAIHPDRVAVIHGARRITYREFDERARRLASALIRRGIGPGDTVSAVLPNVPAMLDAHFGVAMAGAVLNTINTRLDARTIAYILEHGEAKVLLTDREYAGTVGPALAKLGRKLLIVEVEDALYQGPGEQLGEIEYEAFLATGSEEFNWAGVPRPPRACSFSPPRSVEDTTPPRAPWPPTSPAPAVMSSWKTRCGASAGGPNGSSSRRTPRSCITRRGRTTRCTARSCACRSSPDS